MVEGVVEVVLQLLGELLIQIFGELLFELGLRGVGESLKRKPESPALATLGHFVMGATAGGLSLLVFPESFVGHELRIVNLIVTPILAGAWMAAIGALVRRRGRHTIRLESFGYGFAFAFALNLVRFLFTA